MEKIDVKVIRKEYGMLPKYMTEGAAGMDVYAAVNEPIKIAPLERVLVPTGLHFEIPFGYEIQVRPRSGLALNHGITLVNSPGTIDSDYRGEVKIIMINLSNEQYEIKPGERICQFVLQKVYHAVLKESDVLEESSRASGGFGHTGKK